MMMLALNLVSVGGAKGQHLSGKMPSHDTDRAGLVDRAVVGCPLTDERWLR
jgi:hypothetical protein